MNKQPLKNPSYNTFLVFLSACKQFKEWRAHHPDEDPKHEFPGFDVERIRQQVKMTKDDDTRTLWAAEVVQHLDLLNRNFLVSLRHCISSGDDQRYTLTRKGETLYDQMMNNTVQGEKLAPFVMSPQNADCWRELFLLAVLSSGLPFTDEDLSNTTTLSKSSVGAARRSIVKGFMAEAGGSMVFCFQVDLVESKRGRVTQYRLPKDAFGTPDDDTDLDALFDSITDDPPDPPVATQPEPPPADDKGDAEADTSGWEDLAADSPQPTGTNPCAEIDPPEKSTASCGDNGADTDEPQHVIAGEPDAEVTEALNKVFGDDRLHEIIIRVTPDEYAALQREADARNCKVTTMICEELEKGVIANHRALIERERKQRELEELQKAQAELAERQAQLEAEIGLIDQGSSPTP